MGDKSYFNVHSSGGLITRQFIDRLSEDNPNEDYVKPSSFKLSPEESSLSPTELENEIALNWESLKERFDKYETQFREMDKSKIRRLWILPLLEALDFNPQYLRENVEVEDADMDFDLSHKGWNDEDAPVIHTVPPDQDLDEKEGSRRGVKTPHDKLQAYLNVADEKWGIVTNGLYLRVLREFHHTYTKGYLEIDIENIFQERNFTDFRTLYRFVHASRFIPIEEDECILETFYKRSVAAGVKVGDDLRENVKEAIEILGNGFLDAELLEELLDNPELTKDYYNEILHIIYRLLFLLYAEQRGMLPMRDSLYADSYSITKLRDKAEKSEYHDNNTDLWHGLKVTFNLIREGSEELNVFGYNGSLFDTTKLDMLKDRECTNADLLEAIHNLTIYESEGVAQRISYLDIGVEEIGSIYESLLDYEPRVLSEDVWVDEEKYPSEEFFLDPRGAKRKSTGSYFTPPKLVNQLIDSALKPVVVDRVDGKGTREEREKALLDIDVCDPATGSGAFLIAANNFLANELAEIRTGTEHPPAEEVRKARRDVLQHCIYGVDVNPMAVELAKVSLWINAAVEDRPLNFLDHHLKCGNSLIGAREDLVRDGIPQDAYAFNNLEGEERENAKEIRKVIRKQKKRKEGDVLAYRPYEEREEYVRDYKHLEDMAEEEAEDIEAKKENYEEIIESPGWTHKKLLYDIWTAAFFWPLEDDRPLEPTDATIRTMLNGGTEASIGNDTMTKAMELAEDHKFFHWELEFPDVFSGDEPGFDCVLGNPPWDKVQIEEEQWFKAKDNNIANAKGDNRKKLIDKLKKNNPTLFQKWEDYKDFKVNEKKFLNHSGKYNLTSEGTLNYYQLFAEMDLNLINSKGKIGLVIASGIATDYYSRNFFQFLMEKKQIDKLYDFENKERIFPIHRSFKFSLLTLTGKNLPKEKADFAFFLTNIDQLKEEKRHFTLTLKELKNLNPNTKTCTIFRNKKDAELVKNIHLNNIILKNENKENEYDVVIHRMFNTTDDDHLFYHSWEIEKDKIKKWKNKWKQFDYSKLPIYESKLIWHFDHRFNTYKDLKESEIVERKTKNMNENKKSDIDKETTFRDWVDKKHVEKKLKKWNWNNDWFLSVRMVTNATNKRTVVSAITPYAGSVNSINNILVNNASNALMISAFLNSFTCDYVARQKVGTQALNQWSLKQLPIILKEKFRNIDEGILETILDTSLKLTYTSYSLQPFAEDLGYNGEPFEWNPKERRHLRAELDAIVAHLYGVTKEDLDYILETFPIVKKEDMKEFDEYRTKKLILDYYDEHEDKIELLDEKEGED